jgi:hypothetical protein
MRKSALRLIQVVVLTLLSIYVLGETDSSVVNATNCAASGQACENCCSCAFNCCANCGGEPIWGCMWEPGYCFEPGCMGGDAGCRSSCSC